MVMAVSVTLVASAFDTAQAETSRKAESSRKAAKPEPRVRPAAAAPKTTSRPLSEAAQFIAGIQAGRVDVPRVELAARLKAGGFQDTDEFRLMREQAARELAGRPDGTGTVEYRRFVTRRCGDRRAGSDPAW